MIEPIRGLLFGLVFGANLGLLLSNLSLRNKLLERIRLLDEVNAELSEILQQEKKIFQRLKEIKNDNRNNDNSSSSC